MENVRHPVEPGLNAAILHIASKSCPRGWDEVEKFEDAPTTLRGIVEYAEKHGRLCIATEDSDGTIYDDAGVNHALRAWHDSLHYRHGLQFNAAGEAAAAYVHIANLVSVYGNTPIVQYWAALLLTDLLGLVHYHQRTGLWPTDKRAFVMERVDEWALEAARLCRTLCAVSADDPTLRERTAIWMASAKWGNPYHA